jgi:hypothetical protein
MVASQRVRARRSLNSRGAGARRQGAGSVTKSPPGRYFGGLAERDRFAEVAIGMLPAIKRREKLRRTGGKRVSVARRDPEASLTSRMQRSSGSFVFVEQRHAVTEGIEQLVDGWTGHRWALRVGHRLGCLQCPCVQGARIRSGSKALREVRVLPGRFSLDQASTVNQRET